MRSMLITSRYRIYLFRISRKQPFCPRQLALLQARQPYTSDAPKKTTILTESVFGRTRIYTSLPTMAKGKPATTSKTRIGSPVVASPPLSWQWLRDPPSSDNAKIAKSSTEITSPGDKDQDKHGGVLGSLKQSLREMFLPVG